MIVNADSTDTATTMAAENPRLVTIGMPPKARPQIAPTTVIPAQTTELPALAVYLPGFDKVCHAFWQYRFPEDYGQMRPAAEDSAELGPVVDRYLAFVDRTLGRLIAAYGQAPNVIVLSDHGFEANLTHPMWRGWHSARGILIAAGPSFPHRDAPLVVSYYDIVPTVTDVMGFAAPAGMRGSSLLQR